MKLTELFLLEVAKPTVHYIDSLESLPFTLPKKTIGKGQQSKVYDHPTDLATVVKVVDTSKGSGVDIFEKYLNMVLKNQDNPFFPRIYQIYEVKGDDRIVIVMEKLHRINLKKILTTARNYFMNTLGLSKDDIFKDAALSQYGHKGAGEVHKGYMAYKNFYNRESIQSAITTFLTDLIRDPHWPLMLAERSKNPKFIEAVKLISRFNVALDVHSDNLMFRLTNHGPQLVFSDPIF